MAVVVVGGYLRISPVSRRPVHGRDRLQSIERRSSGQWRGEIFGDCLRAAQLPVLFALIDWPKLADHRSAQSPSIKSIAATAARFSILVVVKHNKTSSRRRPSRHAS